MAESVIANRFRTYCGAVLRGVSVRLSKGVLAGRLQRSRFSSSIVLGLAVVFIALVVVELRSSWKVETAVSRQTSAISRQSDSQLITNADMAPLPTEPADQVLPKQSLPNEPSRVADQPQPPTPQPPTPQRLASSGSSERDSASSTQAARLLAYRLRASRDSKSQSIARAVSTGSAMLPYTTASERQQKSRELLDQASHEYRVKAWLSAETSAWTALTYAVESIQLTRSQARAVASSRNADPLAELHAARIAIVEARDFVKERNAQSQLGIETIVRSHRTKVLPALASTHRASAGITTTEAVERYLDDARERLGMLAAESVQAAEAMDLLAAIYLGRNDQKTLPTSTSLCLRRAALQGQPSNASLAARLGVQLAEMGMLGESRQVLEHSYRLSPHPYTQSALVNVVAAIERSNSTPGVAFQQFNFASQDRSPVAPRTADVIQLSPAEFAAVSRPVIQASTASARLPSLSAVTSANEGQHAPVDTRRPDHDRQMPNQAPGATGSMLNDDSQDSTSALRRAWQSIRKRW